MIWRFSLAVVLCFSVCISQASAQRIISLAPDLTETLFAIGAGDNVVGVVSGCDYPLAAKHLTIVGSYSGIDVEKIMALHPDLIVTWGGMFAQQLSVFKQAGVRVFVSNPQRLEDEAVIMQQLGRITRHERIANDRARLFSQELKQLRQTYATKHPLKVFYQIGAYSLLTINKNSWISQIIAVCGGENVFADAATITPEVTWEAVLAANPEVIFNDTQGQDWKKRWQAWPSITAVKRQNMFTINADLIERMSPRVLDGAKQMCQQLKSASV